MNAAQFEKSLLENGIPPRPAALEAVVVEMRKESPDFNYLGEILRQDVALAGGIVQMANSPFFRRQGQIRTVRDAMTVLGLQVLSQTVACIALRQSFASAKLERFWDASSRIASVAAHLASKRAWPGLGPEDAFTFTLFRDCGIAVLLLRSPGYEHVLRRANGESVRSFTDVELDALPTTHVHVGALLTQSWWLPQEISDAIRFHHDIRILVEDGSSLTNSPIPGGLAALAHVAEMVYQRLTGLGETCEWRKLGRASMRRLALQDSDLLSFEATVRIELEGLKK